jgi:hypothetical protein
MSWSTQAMIIVIVYSISALVLGGYAAKNDSIGGGAIIALFILLSAALLGYDTNCLTEGDCSTWSWIRTVLYSIQPIAIIGAVLTGAILLNKQSQAAQ